MRIALLGTGHMATTLGTGFARAGHDVVYGSRTPAEGRDARPRRSTTPARSTAATSWSARSPPHRRSRP